jgi:glucose/arabinose dehydrogenase
MKNCYTFIVACFFFLILNAQPTIGFQSTITGLTVPVDLVAEPASTRMFIVEQPGMIKIWNGSSVLSTPFLNVNSIISYSSGGERGLLSLAFHPQYTTNRYFFIWYTDLTGAVTLARYRRDLSNTDIADPASGVVLLSIPKAFSNHNGAKLNFGTDGFLYIGTGDGGSSNDPSNNAQNGNSLLGKMLRIDVNGFATSAPFYSIPSSNPYTSDAAVADEIIALGLRNPWRWSFDKTSGDMWIADVGQNAWEEVHFRAAADILSPTNYGWRCLEGTHPSAVPCATPANNVMPIYEYPHNSTGGFVVTGGYVYRGSEYPFLQGFYIMVDYATGNGWLIKSNGSGGWNVHAQTGWPTNITTFGEMNDGTLYAAKGNGTVYKVTASAPLPLRLISFTGRKIAGDHELSWEVQQEHNGDNYILERSVSNQNSFVEVARSLALADNIYKRYIVSVTGTIQPAYYRLKTMHTNGQVSYSPIVYMNSTVNPDIKVVKDGGNIVVRSNEIMKHLIISDAAGKVVYQQVINAAGMIAISSAGLPKGILLVKVLGDTGTFTYKILN